MSYSSSAEFIRHQPPSAGGPAVSGLFGRHLDVRPWQVVLERHPGEPTLVLRAGRHRHRRRADYEVVDLRERIDRVPAQDVLTADGVTVKVGAAFTWRVDDAVAFTELSRDPAGSVYLAVQLAVRDAVAALEADAVVRAAREQLSTGLVARVAEAAGAVGIALTSLVVRDVVLPPDLRAAHADLVIGRHRAQAQLESARAETAALRSLANGAKLLDDHPALATLRLVQALPTGSRVELVRPDAPRP